MTHNELTPAQSARIKERILSQLTPQEQAERRAAELARATVEGVFSETHEEVVSFEKSYDPCAQAAPLTGEALAEYNRNLSQAYVPSRYVPAEEPEYTGGGPAFFPMVAAYLRTQWEEAHPVARWTIKGTGFFLAGIGAWMLVCLFCTSGK